MTARIPPQNLEAEQGVLGGILLFNEYLDEVTGIITADDFYLDAHQRIFRAILRLRDAKIPAFDAVTVAEALGSDELKEIGGPDYLATVIGSVPHAAHAKYYAGIVRDRSRQRQLIGVCNDILRESYDPSTQPEESLANAERRVLSLLDSSAKERMTPVREVLIRVLDEVNAERPAGLSTGLTAVDNQLQGLPCGGLTVLAARPGVGKTTLVGTIAFNVASRGESVLFVSLEQPAEEIVGRMLSGAADVDSQAIRSRKLNAEDKDRLVVTAGNLSDLALDFVDGSGMTVSQITAAARAHHRRHGTRLLILDYVQMVEPDDRRAPREQQVAATTRALKNLGKSLRIPVLAVASMNRAVEAREIKRPRLSDLRESGAIESDADVVAFLDRPWMRDKSQKPDLTELIFEKNRHGPTGDVSLYFDGARQRFADAAQEWGFSSSSDFGL